MNKTGLPAAHGLPGIHLPYYNSFRGAELKRTVHAIIRAWILMKGELYGTI